MKRLILVLILTVPILCFGQDQKMSYIGITLGPTVPVGDFDSDPAGSPSSGFFINLINFGYLINDNIGITASWYGAAYPIDFDGADPWSYGGLMIGPLVSFPISDFINWDLRPMIGYNLTNLPTVASEPPIDATSLSLNLGTQFRFHLGERFSFLLSADYFRTKAKFEDLGYDQKIRAISIGFGGAYRF